MSMLKSSNIESYRKLRTSNEVEDPLANSVEKGFLSLRVEVDTRNPLKEGF